jgi:TPP-dependent pyruvate/acetoin dehydrogenase alpha subunit
MHRLVFITIILKFLFIYNSLISSPSSTPMNHIHEDIFYQLLRIRLFEEAVSARYGEEEMRCPVHLSLGQESAAVSVCYFLTTQDLMFSAHRAHAHYLAKGGDMNALLAEFYGKETGCSGGIGGSMHLIDRKAGFWGSVPIVGSTIPIAVGTAFGKKLQQQLGDIVVVFFGDAATEEGCFYESINFAALHHLPVLFVCENNDISVKTGKSPRRPAKADLTKIISAFGVESYVKSGFNCLELTQSLKPILQSMRDEPRPVYVEISVERYAEHCGPKIEKEKTEKHWYGDTDPVYRMKKQISESRYEEMHQQISAEIKSAFEFSIDSVFPKADDLAQYTYYKG